MLSHQVSGGEQQSAWLKKHKAVPTKTITLCRESTFFLLLSNIKTLFKAFLDFLDTYYVAGGGSVAVAEDFIDFCVTICTHLDVSGHLYA